MRLAASHPRIVAYEQYPLEFRPALFSLYPDYPIMGDMRAGSWQFENDQELLHEFLRTGRRLPYENVVKIYAALSRPLSKDPLYFIEKCPVGLDLARAQAALKEFRCVLLVRDPRDVVLSVMAFNRKRGSYALREKEGDTDEELIMKFKRGYDHVISKLSTIEHAHLVRYEDLAVSGESALAALFAWLGVENDPRTVRRCIARAASMEDGRHRTSMSLESSVERWRREMPAHWDELCSRHFGSILAQFGYPPR